MTGYVGQPVMVVWKVGDEQFRKEDALPGKLAGFEPVEVEGLRVYQMPVIELKTGETLRGCECWWMPMGEYSIAMEKLAQTSEVM